MDLIQKLATVIEFLKFTWEMPMTGIVAAGIWAEGKPPMFSTSLKLEKDKWLHAEHVLIRNAAPIYEDALKKSTLIVTLSPCTHHSIPSRIGPPCAEIIERYGIPFVYYGYRDDERGESNLSDFNFKAYQTPNSYLHNICYNLFLGFTRHYPQINTGDILEVKRALNIDWRY